jgi:hypothetical protein
MNGGDKISGVKRGAWPRFAPICGAAILAVAGLGILAQAQETKMLATVDRPATVPVSPLSGPANAGPANAGNERLVVTVDGYEPSAAGPVVFVVTARCGDTTQELGRFGIMESGPVAPGGTMQPQHFGFNLPDDPACRHPSDVIVHVEPTQGDGAGATVSIQGARIE